MNILKRKLAFILALSIPLNLLAACSKNNNKDNPEESFEIEINNKDNPEDNDFNKFNKEDLTKFLIEISEVLPIYNLEDVFLSDDELELLIKESENNQECDNKTLDSTEIYNAIIANSLDESGLIRIADELSLEEKEIIDKLMKECLKQALNNMINNISLEDACIMKDLKLVIDTNIDSCINYFSLNNTLVIDYIGFKELYSKYTNENFKMNLIKEGMTRYLEVGLNYCRTYACNCRLEKGQNIKSIGEGNILDCLMNSAAFSGDNNSMGDINNGLFKSVANNVNYNTSLILLLAVFKENRNIEDLYEIVFNSDLGSLFKYFNLTTKEEIEKFYEIARTIEVLTTDNEYQEEFFTNTTSTYSTAFKDYVGYGYRIDIFKNSISDLMNYIINNKDLNKEEAMFLYKYVKYIILNNTGLNNSDDNFEPDFAKLIITIENIFFEFLSKTYTLSIEEIDELYENTRLFESYNLKKGGETTEINYNKLITKFPLLQFIENNYLAFNVYIDSFDEANSRR